MDEYFIWTAFESELWVRNSPRMDQMTFKTLLQKKNFKFMEVFVIL